MIYKACSHEWGLVAQTTRHEMVEVFKAFISSFKYEKKWMDLDQKMWALQGGISLIGKWRCLKSRRGLCVVLEVLLFDHAVAEK